MGLPANGGALLLPGAPSALHSRLLRHRRADDMRDALASSGNEHEPWCRIQGSGFKVTILLPSRSVGFSILIPSALP